ncbi:MAG: YwaF family protein [Clostridia bacterium]|nr:YwaF family protein [Clostridia bacterium]
MVWGTFTLTHIITLLLGAAITIGLYFALKHTSRRTQTVVLGILSFAGIAAIIYNLVAWDSPIEYLPFHLCSLNAMLLPIVVFTKNKTLGNLLMLWSIGALAALVLNTSVAAAEITSWVFFFYYFPHVLEFGIPLIIFKLKLIELDRKCIWSTTAITFGSYVVIHFINVFVNQYCVANNILDWAGEVVQVNYMFSIFHDWNPLLKLFYDIIPYPFWYMLLCIPVVIIYLACLYYSYDIYKLIRYGKNGKRRKKKEIKE